MQQQDVAAAKPAGQLLEHGAGLATQRIETASCPARELQAEARQNRIQKGVSQARGCSKEPGALARHAADLMLCSLDLIGDRARAQDREAVQMAMRVILDRMATARHFASQFGVPSHSLTDAKESCLRAVLVEQVEHARRDLGIGPVVDRQGDGSSRRRVCWQ